jgi:hypothetical protein
MADGSPSDLDALSKPVGWVDQYSTSVDPADYDDDSAALQALVDDLFANMDGGTRIGHVTLPQRKSDGSSWTFPRTVSLGSDEPADTPVDRGRVVLPHGRGPARVETTIDDGSPLFHLDPVHPVRILDSFGGFTAIGKGNDTEFLRITSCMYWELQNVFAVAFAAGPESTAAIVVDSNSYNWHMNNVQWWGDDTEHADVIGDDNTRDVDNPVTDGHMVLDIHKPCRNGVNFTEGGRSSIAGHIEGAANAGIRCIGGSIFVTDETWFWNTAGDDTNNIQVDDGTLTVGNIYAGRCTGDVVSIGPDMHQFHVEPFTTSWANMNEGNQSGAALAIAEGAGSGTPLRSSVPFPDQFAQDFDVSTLVGNTHVVFPNGKSLAAAGSLAVPAGERRRVQLDGGSPAGGAGAIDVRYRPQNRAQDGSISNTLRYDSGSPAVVFAEESGDGQATIEYEIYEQPPKR